VLPETIDACRAAGMDGYLAKPIEPRRLQEVLETAARKPAGAGSSKTIGVPGIEHVWI
jgi:CheY-like chemotaxis protein